MCINDTAKAMLQKYNTESNNIKVEQGLILIPDISGFTDFVSSICIEAGRYIMCELLTTIMQSNMLGLSISEIEGDAILFYKFCQRPPIEVLIQQYEVMLKNFKEKQGIIEAIVNRRLDVSLKLIAHYGTFTEYTIVNFKKLYGDTVVRAHSLLKNEIQSDTYLLFTKELLDMPGTHHDFHDTATYTYSDYKLKVFS